MPSNGGPRLAAVSDEVAVCPKAWRSTTCQAIAGAISNIPGGMVVDAVGKKGYLMATSLFWVGLPYALMSVTREFGIFERLKLNFSAEAFNITNAVPAAFTSIFHTNGVIQDFNSLPQVEHGELRVTKGSETLFLAVGGGFAEVEGDRVHVLAEHAITEEKIDEKAVEEAMKRVLRSRIARPVRRADHTDEATDDGDARLGLGDERRQERLRHRHIRQIVHAHQPLVDRHGRHDECRDRREGRRGPLLQDLQRHDEPLGRLQRHGA